MPESNPKCTNQSVESAFLDAMRAAGIEYSGPIIADKKLHSVKADGDRTAKTWYVLHPDGLPAGSFGDHKLDIKKTWCAKSSEQLTEEERAERDRRWKQQAEARDAERRRMQDKASVEAQKVLDAAQPATDDHAYLQRKHVHAYPGVMVGPWPQRKIDDALLIPLRTAAGKLASVEAILPNRIKIRGEDRDKDFLSGGAKVGAFFIIGDLEASPFILVCEGYATGATLHEATGYAVAVAFDAGNLAAVTTALKALYPHPKVLMVCGDNDHRKTDRNTGKKAALAVSKKANVRVCLPEFAADEEGSDFNDLADLHGLDRVWNEVESALHGPWRAGKEGQPSVRSEPAPAAPVDLDAYRGTDESNAALFLTLHGADVRYCPPWDKWLLWTGSHWRLDDAIEVRRLVADLPRQLYRDAADAADSSKRRTIADLARKLESGNRQSTLLEMAKCRVVVRHSDLDQGRFLLNTLSGTIDLKTGKVYDHRRSDLLTHDAAIQYDPAATCPTWTRFLLEVFAGDADLIEFVRRAIGYSLTGDVREQILLICHGSGSNGKSVFLNILRKLLGRLALQAAPDLLMADHNRRHPTEQADLYGRRAVVCQETEENRRFNEVLVKQLTGGDSVRARRMREDFWEFEPTWKIWLSTNHRPEIRGTDHAIWRRVRLIPFNVTFHDSGKGEPTKDPAMEEKLTAELPGILAWAVQGCLAWQRDGLPIPKAVHDATEEYREQQDILAAWLKDCCIVKKLADAKAADLYASYSAWCEANGERPEPQRRFGMRLTERGFQRQKRMVGHFWLGVGLLAPDHHDRYDPNDPHSAEKQLEENHEAFIGETASFGSFGSCATSKAPESPPVDTTPPQDIPADTASAAPAESTIAAATCADKRPDSSRAEPPPPPDPLATRVAQLMAAGWAPWNAEARARSEAMPQAKPGARP